MPPESGEVTVQISVRPVSVSGAGRQAWPPAQEVQGAFFYPRWLAPKTAVLSLPPLTVAGRPPAAPGTVNFGDRILLLEADLAQRTLSPGGPVELAVRWACMRAMEEDYTLFVHLLAPDGTLKGQIDVWPRDGTHPTSQWSEGETVEDDYLLYVATDAPSGSYQVEVGWYLLETMQRLPVLDAEGRAVDDRLLLPGLTVQ
jgi:hypothetical protein